MVGFTLTFKLDVPQVLRKVMKCYFQPLVQLLGKFSDNLSQTVERRAMDFTIKKKKNSTNVPLIPDPDGKNGGCKGHLSGRACRTVGISTPEMAL